MMKEEEQPTAVVPEASPDSNEKDEKQKAPASRKKLYMMLTGVALLIAIVLCIALPLELMDSSDDSSDDPSSSTSGSFSTNNGNDKTHIPTEDISRQNDENQGKETDTRVSTGGSLTASLLGSLPLFVSDILNGYENQADLEGAIKIALRQEAQRIIDQNVRNRQQWYEYEKEHGGRPEVYEEEAMTMDSTAAGSGMDGAADMAAVPEAAPNDAMMMEQSESGGGGNGKEVTDFGTNNQEENIDEADVIKADANFIYASYGDYIIIWDTAGNQVAQVQMPPIQLPEDWGKPESEVQPEVEAQVESEVQKSMMMPPDMYRPKPSIQTMLLTDNHLVVFVSGYNEDYSWYGPTTMSPPRKMLYGHRGCHVRVYEKTTTGDVTFVASKDVNGNYVDARSIGDTVHLGTASSVDTWTYIGQPLDWYYVSNNTDISIEEYQRRATIIADRIVPQAAEQLVEELKMDNGEFPTMLQINQWFTQVNDTSSGTAGVELPYYQEYNPISNVAQVTSFNVNDALEADGTIATSASAYMSPSYFSTLYGTNDHLVLATSGWDFNPARQESEQTTYVVALEIDGASTSFLSVGTLKGHLLNQYALDIVGDELHAATTVERFQRWWGPFMMDDMEVMPMPMEEMPMAEEAMTEEAATTESTPVSAAEARGGGRRQLEDQCGTPPDASDPCDTPDNYENCAVLVEKGCSLIEKSDDCPPQYTCAIVGVDVNGLCPPVDDLGRDDCLNKDNLQKCINLSTQGCPQIAVMESCPVQFRCSPQALAAMDPDGLCPLIGDDDCVDDDNYLKCVRLVDQGCTDIVAMESCPKQFSCRHDLPEEATTTTQSDEPNMRPPEEDEEESRTENYMVALNLVGDTPGQMSYKGSVQIGEKNERITSVRFFDNVAYAVTFEQTDPFYVVDMSVPKVLGELKIPGFSSYLHSMNADNTLLLAVGQNATQDGIQTGLMVTVFDATDPANPQALVGHVFEQDDMAYSGSSIQWDYKAFRYVDGKLIMPMEIWYQQEWDPVQQIYLPLPEGAENFRGFVVLAVDTTSIEELYRVSHNKGAGVCHYCGGYLPQRSFVYSGILMTIRENLVIGTDFDSGEEQWTMTIEVEGEPAECCG